MTGNRSIRIAFLCMILAGGICAQGSFQKFFVPSDTLKPHRAWLASGFAFSTYSIFSIGLYDAWYKKTKRSDFHFFDDSGEWNNLDKVAHSYNSYIQTSNVFHGARWCGYSETASVLWGISVSTLFQTTIEIMDGFSADWGFSWPDIGGNILGAGLFASQQLIWHEQKFKLKLSAWPKDYPNLFITGDQGNTIYLKDRANKLYGRTYFSSLLKDYNAQTFWLSFHPEVFSKSTNKFWPDYLNLSIGIGADNLYGGFKNEWQSEQEVFSVSQFPRYSQYYLSLDIDLKKIKVKNNFLRSLLHIVNIVKIPAPALEYNSQGKVKWHWIYF
jgi:uncharacterized protein YfiM (DUF2279 family)